MTGLAVIVVYNLLPFSLYWGTSILPDVMGIFLSTVALCFLIFKNKYVFLISVAAFSILVLIKPFFAVLLIPAAYYLWKNYRKKEILFLIFFVVSVFICWNIYLWSIPKNDIYAGSTFNLSESGLSLFFDGYNPVTYVLNTNWPVILVQRLIDELTPFGFIMLIYCLIRRRTIRTFYLVWLISTFFTLIIVNSGNYAHEYYQFIFIPVAAVFIGIGFVDLLIKAWKNGLISIIALIVLILYFGYIPHNNNLNARFNSEVRFIEFYSDVNNIQSKIPRYSSTILVGDDSPTLLNVIDRNGWIISHEKCEDNEIHLMELIKDKFKLGADFIVVQTEPYYQADDSSYSQCLKVIQTAEDELINLYKGDHLYLYKKNDGICFLI